MKLAECLSCLNLKKKKNALLSVLDRPGSLIPHTHYTYTFHIFKAKFVSWLWSSFANRRNKHFFAVSMYMILYNAFYDESLCTISRAVRVNFMTHCVNDGADITASDT